MALSSPVAPLRIRPADASRVSSARVGVVPLACAVAAGLFVRLVPVARADFPLNDGGMFYAMARDVVASGGRLPAQTTYNHLDIPFAYPPLGFYVAAFLNATAHIDLFEVLRVVPFLASVLTLIAFAILVRSIISARFAAMVAAFIFALHPRDFSWEIMGGGLTRSIGLLFAVLAIGRIHAMYRQGRRRDITLAALFSTLTVLSHLEMALFVAVTALVFFLAYGRSREGVAASAIVAAVTLIGVAPWLYAVMSVHGTVPFLAVINGSVPAVLGPSLLLTLRVSDEPLFPVLGCLGLIGFARGIARREWVIPGWFVTLYLVDGRQAPSLGIVPLAMLGGLAAELIVESFGQSGPFGQRAGKVFIAALLGYAGFATLVGEPQTLQALSVQEQTAMSWAQGNTPADSRFLVITGDTWAVNRTAEWFPVLAERQSVATVQGSEWLPHGAFPHRLKADDALGNCARTGVACLREWQRRYRAAFDYLFIVKRPSTSASMLGVASTPTTDCCEPLREELAHDPNARLVYENSAAAVYRWLDGP